MALAHRWVVALVAGVVLTDCAGRPQPIALAVDQDPRSPEFGVVEVWGLTPSVRRALARVPPEDPRWISALGIRVGNPGDDVPAFTGRYIVAGRCVRFLPRYRPEGPLTYRVRLDPGALARLAGRPAPVQEVEEREYRLPGRAVPPPTTRVTGIYPAAAVVPANQLRWYVEFSAPMREGEAARHVRLQDESGRVVDGAFLTVQDELWDPEHRRLTLFFDMGRVKRALRTRMEAGPVLHPGRRYTLRIDSTWRDARGAPLVEDVVHRFQAGIEDHAPVEPSRWRVVPPPIGTRAPLSLDFGESLDHALAQHLIAVTGADGRPISGSAVLGPDDRSWRFIPETPWYGERYRVRVHPALEDLAGNRVGHVFDADLARGEHAGVDSLGVTLEFLPTGELGTR